MAAEEPSQTLSAFPDPPNFYTHFTPENISALRQHRRSLSLPHDAPVPRDTLPATSPLQYLIPPPLPESGSYWSFAQYWQTPERHPSLEHFGIQRLYSEEDEVSGANRVVELRRLSKSLLLSFLELVALMGSNPTEANEKTTDLQTILFNMHHLINQYRPHQARETLCLMMEAQLERVRRETEENRAIARRVDEALMQVEFMARRVKETEAREKEIQGARVVESAEDKARRKDREGWERILNAV